MSISPSAGHFRHWRASNDGLLLSWLDRGSTMARPWLDRGGEIRLGDDRRNALWKNVEGCTPSVPTYAVADFKSHITGSTLVGIGYGYWGVTSQSMSLESGIVAAGLCSVSGMLPDLDSDSGVPLRETSMFVAAVVPILMIDRFRDLGLSHEAMAVAAMLVYVAIRFVAVEFFRRYTVHRGMWHSLPAAANAGLIAYLVMPCQSESMRVYKSLGVVLGFIVHLIMDEIWSVDAASGFRLKKSFGTALKFFGRNPLTNLAVYAKLSLLIYLAWCDSGIEHRIRMRARMEQTYIANPQEPPVDITQWIPWR